MHHLTPNTWPFGQQTDPLAPSPSSLLQKGVKTCPYPPWGMLGKEGLYICPKPQGEPDTERNIPSCTRQKERRQEREAETQQYSKKYTKKALKVIAVVTADIREEMQTDRQKMKESFKDILWKRDGSWLLMKPSITPWKAPWGGQREGSTTPGPASKGPREERREAGGRLQCASGVVIFNSLPPVKSAGKVIRPASLLLLPSNAGCNTLEPLNEACC